MNINIKKALCEPFEGDKWQIKLIIGSLIVFYPIYSLNIDYKSSEYFTMISILSMILYLAYISIYIHNQLQGEENILPAWSINKLLFCKTGLKAFVVFILFSILCMITFFPLVFVPILPFAAISFSESFKIRDAFRIVNNL